jgi:hypothetical protein
MQYPSLLRTLRFNSWFFLTTSQLNIYLQMIQSAFCIIWALWDIWEIQRGSRDIHQVVFNFRYRQPKQMAGDTWGQFNHKWKFYLKDKRRLIELELSGYLLLLVLLLKSPILVFVYFRFIQKSKIKKDVKSTPSNNGSMSSDMLAWNFLTKSRHWELSKERLVNPVKDIKSWILLQRKWS